MNKKISKKDLVNIFEQGFDWKWFYSNSALPENTRMYHDIQMKDTIWAINRIKDLQIKPIIESKKEVTYELIWEMVKDKFIAKKIEKDAFVVVNKYINEKLNNFRIGKENFMLIFESIKTNFVNKKDMWDNDFNKWKNEINVSLSENEILSIYLKGLSNE